MITVEQKTIGKGHRYIVTGHDGMLDEEGKPIKMPSVTGVIGATDGSSTHIISRWAVKQAIEYAKRGVAHGVHSEIGLQTVLDDARKQPDMVFKTAGARGTRIHKAIEEYLLNKPWKIHLDDESDDLAKIETCFKKIRKWILESGMKIMATELPIYHKDLLVGGAIDLVLSDNKSKIYVCDFKTGSGVYTKDALQVSGYVISLISMLEDGVQLWDRYNATMPHGINLNKLSIGGAIFHIKEDSEEVDLKHVNVANGTVFGAAALLYTHQKSHSFHEVEL